MNRLDELLAGYLDDSLSENEIAGLAEEVERDDASRRRFLELTGVDGLLRAEFVPPGTEERLLQRSSLWLVGEEQERRTASAVMHRICGDRPRRSRRLRPDRISSGPALWALAAACAAVFITVLVFSTQPDTPRRVSPPSAPVADTDRVVPNEESAPPTPVSKPGPVPPKSRPVPAASPRSVPVAPTAPPFAPSPPPPLPPPPRQPIAPPTIAALATVETTEGTVLLRNEPASRGSTIRAGDALITRGPSSRVTFVFTDRTRVRLAGDSIADKISLNERGGKHILLKHGSLTADVSKQPAGRPFSIRTPRADVRVLGTRLSLDVKEDATRLEVEEGRVRLTRRADGRSVDVRAGHYALAADGIALTARKIVPTLFADSFEESPLDQWPAQWIRHATQPGTRSGFRVTADPARAGNRILGIPQGGGPTQHAFIPLQDWPDDVIVRFRMRLTGTRISRAGIQFESGSLFPSLEFDATADVLRVDWPRGKALSQTSLRIPPGQWTAWIIRVRRDRFTVTVAGRTLLDRTVSGFGPITAASLVSRGADPAEFDDVRVERAR